MIAHRQNDSTAVPKPIAIESPSASQKPMRRYGGLIGIDVSNWNLIVAGLFVGFIVSIYVAKAVDPHVVIAEAEGFQFADKCLAVWSRSGGRLAADFKCVGARRRLERARREGEPRAEQDCESYFCFSSWTGITSIAVPKR